MAYLVIGGSGFLGLNLAEQLLSADKHVILYDLAPPPAAAVEMLKRLPGRLDVVLGDVLSRDQLETAIQGRRIDHVIHAAAITAGAHRELAEPRRIAEVNLLGTIEALEFARRHQVKRLVYVGTGSVYGASGLKGAAELEEDVELPLPASMYGITKYAAERTCLRYRELSGLDLVVARLAMVFGRWEYHTAARDTLSLPVQIYQLALHGKAAVLPQGALSDWIYAPDAARALIALADADRPEHTVYNIGTGMPWPLSAWCDRVRASFPGFSYSFSADPNQLTVGALAVKGRKPFAARRLGEGLGFRAQYPLDAAYEDYENWLRSSPL